MTISNKFSNLILFTIIVILTISFILSSSQKMEYSIDEIYSLVFANSSHADSFSSAYNLWGTWAVPDDYIKLTTVQDGERFSFSSAYNNTIYDCHPPLYYWCLHFACSLFYKTNTMYVGIGLNGLLFVATCILIYVISTKLIQSKILSFLPVITYGLSAFAVETYTFIRMYMLLSFFAVLFSYANVSIIQSNCTKKKYLFLAWLSVFLGAMTQYYFLVFSFWGVLFVCLLFLKRREFKKTFLYGSGNVISVLLMLLIFPYAISQATGISTNDIGNEVVSSLFDFKLWIDMTWELLYSALANLSYFSMKISLVILLIIGCIIIYLIVSDIIKGNKIQIPFETVWLGVIFILSFLSISFIGGKNVFLRYVYFIFPILFLFLFSIIDHLNPVFNVRVMICVVSVAFSIFNFIFGYINKSNPNLFLETTTQNNLLNMYSDNNLIIATDTRAPEIPTGNYSSIIRFNKIYMDTKDNILKSDVIVDCLDSVNECVIYVPTDTRWISGFSPESTILELTDGLSCKYRKISNGSLGEFYLLTR